MNVHYMHVGDILIQLKIAVFIGLVMLVYENKAFGTNGDSGKILLIDSHVTRQKEIDLSKLAFPITDSDVENKKKVIIETWLDFRSKKHRKWIEEATIVSENGVFSVHFESSKVRTEEIDGSPVSLYQYIYKAKRELGSFKSAIALLGAAQVKNVKFLEGKTSEINSEELLRKIAASIKQNGFRSGGYRYEIEFKNKDVFSVSINRDSGSKSQKDLKNISVKSCQFFSYEKFNYIDCPLYRFLAEDGNLIELTPGEMGSKKLVPLIQAEINGMEHLIIRGSGDLVGQRALQKKNGKWIKSEIIKIWNEHL